MSCIYVSATGSQGLSVPLSRPVTRASDRAELSHSALGDSMTPRESKAVQAKVESPSPSSERLGREQVQKDTEAAGKAFMDTLAQNVGLGAASGW